MARRKSDDSSEPKPTAQKPIQIVSVKRGRRNVVIHYTKGDASFELDERDNPLPEFYAAFDALPTVAATICHLGPKYTGTGLRVIKLDVGEKGGVATVALHCRKDIDDAAKEFAFKTPERLLAHPTQEGKYTPPLPPTDVALVEEMIEQAKQYVMGNRAQGEIQFEEKTDDDAEGDGDQLKFEGAAAK